MSKNKIKFGLKNVHYATITNTAGVITYGTPVKVEGAVSISLSPEVERTAIPADDNKEYAVIFEDNGYSGDLEIQVIDDAFRVAVFGATLNADGVLIESKDDAPNPVALLFEFDGDVNKKRHVLYNCLITKPSIESETGKANKTDKLSISARPAEDTGHVKASVLNDTAGATAYASWFSTVYVDDTEE